LTGFLPARRKINRICEQKPTDGSMPLSGDSTNRLLLNFENARPFKETSRTQDSVSDVCGQTDPFVAGRCLKKNPYFRCRIIIEKTEFLEQIFITRNKTPSLHERKSHHFKKRLRQHHAGADRISGVKATQFSGLPQ
jgi:hypothetical protein